MTFEDFASALERSMIAYENVRRQTTQEVTHPIEIQIVPQTIITTQDYIMLVMACVIGFLAGLIVGRIVKR